MTEKKNYTKPYTLSLVKTSRSIFSNPSQIKVHSAILFDRKSPKIHSLARDSSIKRLNIRKKNDGKEEKRVEIFFFFLQSGETTSKVSYPTVERAFRGRGYADASAAPQD